MGEVLPCFFLGSCCLLHSPSHSPCSLCKHLFLFPMPQRFQQLCSFMQGWSEDPSLIGPRWHFGLQGVPGREAVAALLVCGGDGDAALANWFKWHHSGGMPPQPYSAPQLDAWASLAESKRVLHRFASTVSGCVLPPHLSVILCKAAGCCWHGLETHTCVKAAS